MALTVNNLSTGTGSTLGYPNNNLVITGTGGALLKNAGGNLLNVAVTAAGSADSLVSLYNGTSTSAPLITTFSGATGGAIVTGNYAFSALYCNVVGTTGPTLQILTP